MKKRLILAAAVTMVAIGACMGAASQMHEPQLTELQQANVDALDNRRSSSSVVKGLCGGKLAMLCRAYCETCGQKYYAEAGGPASEVAGSCIICGGNRFIPE